MTHCTYIYWDPKTLILRYVGEGSLDRPYDHLKGGKRSSNARLCAMLSKRKREGFNPQPYILPMGSKEEAVRMEKILIADIGRLDLGLGTLFNHTDGGDGISGYRHTQEALKKISDRSKLQAGQSRTGWSKESKEVQSLKKLKYFEEKGVNQKSLGHAAKPCTIDGTKIYSSRISMVKDIGSGKNGARNINFHYLEKESSS